MEKMGHEQSCSVEVSGNSKKLPLGVRAIEALCSRKGSVNSKPRARTAYQVMIFSLTFWMYAVYTLTRRPFTVVKIVLCPLCARLGDNLTNSSSYNDTDDRQVIGWPPFNGSNGSTLLGSVDYSLIFAYATGLYISGYIADRVNIRYFLTIGLAGSGLAAAMLGFGYFANVHHLSYFLIFQIIAGFMQSTGWPGLLGITAKWFGKKNRGFVMGVWTSCSFLGSILGYIVPSFFIYSENVQDSPWGWCFITPALITFLTAALTFLFLVDDPIHLGFLPAKQTIAVTGRKENKWNQNSNPSGLDSRIQTSQQSKDEFEVMEEFALNHVEEKFETEVEVKLETDEPVPAEGKAVKSKALGFFGALLIPGVVEYSIALFFNKLVTYSFNFWLPFYVASTYQEFGGKRSAWLATLFDVGGIVGGLGIGFISDKLLSARALLLVPMLLLGIPILYIFRVFGILSLIFYSIMLFLIGVFINGPHIIIAGAVANDLGTHKSLDNQGAKSLVSGIIDGTGSMGAAIGPLIMGVVYNKFKNWDVPFSILMFACFISAMFLTRLLVSDIKKVGKWLSYKIRSKDANTLETVNEDTQEATEEDTQEATKEDTQEATKEDTQKATKEDTQKASKEATMERTEARNYMFESFEMKET